MNEIENISGYLLINKPLGWTSYDIVGYLRKITSIRKIGHAGTLDPLASGLLIVAIGRAATKQIDSFSKMNKEYLARVFLGRTTDTYDQEGKVTSRYQGSKILKRNLMLALDKFQGQIEQIPPMYSAKKINGQKLYKLARQGIEVERRPAQIEIKDIRVKRYIWPNLDIQINCSSGTYIRSLAHDLGQSLGCGGYLKKLQRTKIGPFGIDEALKIAKITTGNYKKYLSRSGEIGRRASFRS